MKEKIKGLLVTGCANILACRIGEQRDKELDEIAAELAKFLNDKWAQRKALHTRQHELDMAKMVVLAEALKMSNTFTRAVEWQHPDMVAAWPIREVLDKALKSAPSVLWSGEGHLFHQIDLPEYNHNPYTILDILGDHIPLGDGHIGKDGQHVEVILTEQRDRDGTEDAAG